jgi:hypothetical protein
MAATWESLGRLADKQNRDMVPFQTPSLERLDVVADAGQLAWAAEERCRNLEENMGIQPLVETHDTNELEDTFQVVEWEVTLRTFDNTLQSFLDPSHKLAQDEATLGAVPAS